MTRYTLDAGRCIVQDGIPVVSIRRIEGLSAISPVEADDLARNIVIGLNGLDRAPRADSGLILNCDAIDSTPIRIDWAEEHRANGGEGWRAIEAMECPRCKRVVVMADMGECECREMLPDIEEEIDGEICEVPNPCTETLYSEGPMMSYYYPVKLGDVEEAARTIAHLPLCVVEFSDDRGTALALTGGGMDLSWEICDAFLALGFWPPLHFCDLPRMSGRGTSDRDLAIIAACEESCRIAESWAARKRGRLAELRQPVAP